MYATWLSGDHFQINGMRNNASGIFEVIVDDQMPFELDLFSENVTCGLFVDYFLGNGTHQVTVTLKGASSQVDEGHSSNPVMHLTEMMYATTITLRVYVH